MILSKDEVDFYNEKGYLLVEDVITEDQHNEMLRLVKDFFEKSKNVKKNDNIFDLEDGHSSTNPRLKRVKQPHQHSKFFWDIIKQSNLKANLKTILKDKTVEDTDKFIKHTKIFDKIRKQNIKNYIPELVDITS